MDIQPHAAASCHDEARRRMRLMRLNVHHTWPNGECQQTAEVALACLHGLHAVTYCPQPMHLPGLSAGGRSAFQRDGLGQRLGMFCKQDVEIPAAPESQGCLNPSHLIKSSPWTSPQWGPSSPPALSTQLQAPASGP